MRTQRKPFVVEKRHLPAKASPKEPKLVVVDKGERDERKRREKWAKAITAQAFQHWRPGF
jgi:hypothetical protein